MAKFILLHQITERDLQRRFINPEQVMIVSRVAAGNSLITFANDSTMTVLGPPEEVISKLEGRTEQLLWPSS